MEEQGRTGKPIEEAFAVDRSVMDYSGALREVIQIQGAFWGGEWGSESEANLIYALSRVAPSTHLEIAFVVAVIERVPSNRDIVDEFVRRRAAEQPLWPDHPLLDLQKWGMPNTYRLPVFQEQIHTLIREVTGWGGRHAWDYLDEIFKARASRKPLREVATPECQASVSTEELDIIDSIISYNAPRSRQYAWCSTMAERAWKIVVDGGLAASNLPTPGSALEVPLAELPWRRTIFCQFDHKGKHKALFEAINDCATERDCTVVVGTSGHPDIFAFGCFIQVIDRNSVGDEMWREYAAAYKDAGDITPCFIIDDRKDLPLPNWKYAKQIDMRDPSVITTIVGTIRQMKMEMNRRLPEFFVQPRT